MATVSAAIYGDISGLRILLAGQGVHDYVGTPPYVYVELTAVQELAWNRRGLPAMPP